MSELRLTYDNLPQNEEKRSNLCIEVSAYSGFVREQMVRPIIDSSGQIDSMDLEKHSNKYAYTNSARKVYS
jgi:hypothetical protein